MNLVSPGRQGRCLDALLKTSRRTGRNGFRERPSLRRVYNAVDSRWANEALPSEVW